MYKTSKENYFKYQEESRKHFPFAGKKIYFPDNSDITDFIQSISLKKSDHKEHIIKSNYDGFMRIGRWLRYTINAETKSYYVTITDKLLDFIKSNITFIAYDTLYFELIDWGNDIVLLKVSHNNILGDRWIALLDKETVLKVLK